MSWFLPINDMDGKKARLERNYDLSAASSWVKQNWVKWMLRVPSHKRKIKWLKYLCYHLILSYQLWHMHQSSNIWQVIQHPPRHHQDGCYVDRKHFFISSLIANHQLGMNLNWVNIWFHLVNPLYAKLVRYITR
jgi:hypothetical protein